MLPPSTLGCDESPCFKGIIGCFNPMMPPSTLGCEELSFQGQRWVFSPNVALVTLGCEELPHFKGDIGCVQTQSLPHHHNWQILHTAIALFDSTTFILF